MNKNIQIVFSHFNNLKKSLQHLKYHLFLGLLAGALPIPSQEIRSEEIYLKCSGKFEINRGALIKPDWETSYVTINLDSLKSTIVDKGKRMGSTLVNDNNYTITHRDNRNNIKNIYKINVTHGTFSVEHFESNRNLIGTCQKGRG